MTDRDLLKQALEALERCVSTCFDQRAHEEVMSRPEHFVNQNIAALRERLAQLDQDWSLLEATQESLREHMALVKKLQERLAQPVQEPVAWIDEFGNVFPLGAQRGPKWLNEPMKPLYTTPPRREWVGLTDEEKLHLEIMGGKSDVMLAEAIEAKLKEKNT